MHHVSGSGNTLPFSSVIPPALTLTLMGACQWLEEEAVVSFRTLRLGWG